MEDTNTDTNKSGSSLPSGSPLRTGRCPLPTMRSPSPFSRSPSPLSPNSSPSGSSSPLCPLNNESPKSPMVDLEVEEQEGSQGSLWTEEEREQEPTNEDLDTSKKRKTILDVWAHFTRKKVEGKVKAQCHYCGKLYLGDSSQGSSIIYGESTFQSILDDGEPNEDDGSCAIIDGSCITIDED
ncbi:uncharacterized protein LOC136064127 isoform X2 [Quercus suber]|uniref:uncharacterized protein LOC136064127 isoform X2 n=1 Tax=Quercus suber TaxID=58331 RepID=UPI0032DE61C6